MESMRSTRGFGLIELMVTLVVASLLLAVAVPGYNQYTNRAKVAAAIGDIGKLSMAIEQYRLRNQDRIPQSLSDLGVEVPLDPWDRPYAYLHIPSAKKADLRKDGRLNPLNTDFDLYSLGKDGVSAGPVSARKSHDDILRANNGSFIGLGEEY
jgi:general secretion pathway protein G